MKTKIINGCAISTDNEIRPSRIHGFGTIVREYKSLKPSKDLCIGCRDDYYNYGGNSHTGECWRLSDARVVDKVGHSSLNVVGGPDAIMRKTHSCWHSVRK